MIDYRIIDMVQLKVVLMKIRNSNETKNISDSIIKDIQSCIVGTYLRGSDNRK